MLRPLNLASHAWFLFTSMVIAVYTVFVLDELRFDAFLFGVTFAAGGFGGLLGASLSGPAERRFSLGPVILAARWLTPVAYALVPLATSGAGGFALLCVAQFLFYLSATLDSPVEMAYRQTITPDRLLGRVNATTRSINRGMIVFGALIGGVLADRLGNRTALWIAVAGLVGQAVWLGTTAVRRARL